MKMNRLNFLTAGGAILVFLFMACAPREAPATGRQAAPIKPEADVKTGWEAEWEKTLKEAQKEGSVSIYGGSGAIAIHRGLVDIFRDKFGIKLEVISGRSAETVSKIMAERNAGLYLADAYLSGADELVQKFKPAGAIEVLEPMLLLPEVKDNTKWLGGKLNWVDKDHKILNIAAWVTRDIAYNTDVIKEGEITSYADLLDPKWKEKIVMNDPTVSGAGFSAFRNILANKIVTLDYYRALVEQQKSLVLRDQFIQIRWMVMGKYPITLAASSGRMDDYIKEGAPVKFVSPKEGERLAEGGASLAWFNKSPHPNATKIFLNWFLGKEGQYLWQGAHGKKQSRRVDIKADNINPSAVRPSGVKLFPDITVNEDFILSPENERLINLAIEVLGPHVR